MVHPYIAHVREASGEIQPVREHSLNTAKLCQEYGVPDWKDFLYVLGLLHDVGKYQPAFQRRIRGEAVRVEHSLCGALAAQEKYPMPASLMLAYCIAGHHGGLPDGGFANDTEEQPTLQGRLKRQVEGFGEYQSELDLPELDVPKWTQLLIGDCGKQVDRLVDKFAFLTRYAFSCLVDADSSDTAAFCREGTLPRSLKGNFSVCLEKINHRLQSFVCHTPLQKARLCLQEQAFRRAGERAEIYLLNMPTGSGKTLASVKIALERALAEGKKRIIYVIPYNSIIDQTAEVLENLFGEDLEILRHQSTFSYEEEENGTEDYREAAKTAAENWDAPFIITTAVQFFESVYSNKRGKLRKLHNMADSILVFDEAHTMPSQYLQPCLQAVSYIVRYLHSQALFLTATMPDFPRLLQEYALPDTQVRHLITDTGIFSIFQKCQYSYLGEVDPHSLLEKSAAYPSSLIIVNRKATARALYQECSGKKFHLSTYMTGMDRQRVLQDIRRELDQLAQDFPHLQDVPAERRITVISTSLIEAGVDLDVYTVFRETAGLDSILQAGGRCNREGKRKRADVFVFDFLEASGRKAIDEKTSLTKGLLQKYADISEPACIAEYYDRLFRQKSEEIQKNTMHQMCVDIRSIPFRQYAEQFSMIDSRTVSLVVPQDEKSRALVEQLQFAKSANVRQLQNYTCTLYPKELEDLLHQHAADDYGTGIYCLTNMDYYHEDTGIGWDAPDYFL